MGRSTKLTLDILLGAVVPILVLAYLTDPLGAIPAYLLSALIPVGWVAVDLIFVTRRFNYITAFLGLNAIMRGLLAFWFVDGYLYAIKDTAGSALAVLIFGGSLLVGSPLVRAFVEQSLDPRSPKQESALRDLFRERPVARALFWSTALLAAANVATGAVNFVLNLNIVTASFGTEAFNSQVARVNAITRLALGIPEFAVWAAALALIIYSIHRTLHAGLPEAAGKQHDLWDLIELREAQDRKPTADSVRREDQ